VSAAARAMARLRTPNFVPRRLIFIKSEIQIYQHTANRLMGCYSLAISAREGAYADWVRNALYLGKSRGREFMRNSGNRSTRPFCIVQPQRVVMRVTENSFLEVL
jgi:hypothetical protein